MTCCPNCGHSFRTAGRKQMLSDLQVKLVYGNHRVPLRQAAEVLGVSVAAISKRAHELGLPQRPWVTGAGRKMAERRSPARHKAEARLAEMAGG